MKGYQLSVIGYWLKVAGYAPVKYAALVFCEEFNGVKVTGYAPVKYAPLVFCEAPVKHKQKIG